MSRPFRGVLCIADRNTAAEDRCGCGKPRLRYLAAYEDAEQRMRRGERQVFCPECRCWVWPDHCEHSGRMTLREHQAVVRAAKIEAGRYDTDAKRYTKAYRKEE